MIIMRTLILCCLASLNMLATVRPFAFDRLTAPPADPSGHPQWSITAVDDIDSGYVAHHSDTSLAVDSANLPHISYRSGGPNYATRDSAGSWTTMNVPSGWRAAARENAIAVDSTDHVHISYSYSDGDGEDLHYATNATGTWQYQTVDVGLSTGMENDIAVDSQHRPHISHWDWAVRRLNYSTNLTGQWTTEVVDSTVQWQRTSIALDSTGGVHITYAKGSTIYHAVQITATWQIAPIASGSHPQLVIDTADHLHLTFQQNGHLIYATNAGGAWAFATVAYNVWPERSHALALDPGGKVHISYFNASASRLEYVSNSTGAWVTQIVDDSPGAGRSNSIAVDAGGIVHISYRYDTVAGPFEGVWGSSAADVFAVGWQGLIAHYDGTRWSSMTSGTTASLYDIWGSSPGSLFAVGSGGTVLRYNGSAWASMSTGTTTDLYGVWGSSATDIFAVGASGTIRHYDGTAWQGITSPVTIVLRGVWGSSSSDVFVVGDSGTILHFDGTAWSAMPSATTGSLQAVWGSSPTDVFAVATNGDIVHFDGSGWSRMDSRTFNSHYGVCGASHDHVIAVDSSGAPRHYDGRVWSGEESGAGKNLVDCWSASANDVFAAGSYHIARYNGQRWTNMLSAELRYATTAPALKAAPGSLNTVVLKGENAAATVEVAYTGQESLEWLATKNVEWLNVAPVSGTVIPGESIQLDLTIDSAAMAPGHYSGAITVSSVQPDGPSTTVPVSLAVLAYPETKVLPHFAMTDDYFGQAVSLDGEVALIGAYGVDASKGAAHVFRRIDGLWHEEAKLVAPWSDAYDYFGYAVALRGPVALVGAYADDDLGANAGAAYVFRWDGSTWIEEVKLMASDGAAEDYFGSAVALGDGVALIGAYGDDDRGSTAGAAYVFRWNGTEWVEEAKLTAADGAANDQFAASLSLSEDVALVGALRNDSQAQDAGAAYVFRRSGDQWSQEAKLTASNGGYQKIFGRSVAVRDTSLLIGASGAAYLFRHEGTGWIESDVLTSPSTGSNFGASVALDQDRVMVGTTADSAVGGLGAAYVYEAAGSQWLEAARLSASDGAEGDAFGASVAFDGQTVLFGAPSSDRRTRNAGAAYFYHLPTSAPASLASGWNLLALDLDPETALHAQSWLDAVNSQGGECSEVDRWLNGAWDAHVDGSPLNDFGIEPGKAYFLRCSAASQWTLRGYAFHISLPVHLQPGWNLLSVPYTPTQYTAQSLLDAIAGQGGACSEVHRWVDGSWDVHINSMAFNDFALTTNQGYYLLCSQPSTFVPGGSP